jgi:hypothetical protein
MNSVFSDLLATSREGDDPHAPQGSVNFSLLCFVSFAGLIRVVARAIASWAID